MSQPQYYLINSKLPRNKSSDKIAHDPLGQSNHIKLQSNQLNKSHNIAIQKKNVPSQVVVQQQGTHKIPPRQNNMLVKSNPIQIEGDLNFKQKPANTGNIQKNINNYGLFDLLKQTNHNNGQHKMMGTTNNKIKNYKQGDGKKRHMPRKSPVPQPRGFLQNNANFLNYNPSLNPKYHNNNLNFANSTHSNFGNVNINNPNKVYHGVNNNSINNPLYPNGTNNNRGHSPLTKSKSENAVKLSPNNIKKRFVSKSPILGQSALLNKFKKYHIINQANNNKKVITNTNSKQIPPKNMHSSHSHNNILVPKTDNLLEPSQNQMKNRQINAPQQPNNNILNDNVIDINKSTQISPNIQLINNNMNNNNISQNKNNNNNSNNNNIIINNESKRPANNNIQINHNDQTNNANKQIHQNHFMEMNNNNINNSNSTNNNSINKKSSNNNEGCQIKDKNINTPGDVQNLNNNQAVNDKLKSSINNNNIQKQPENNNNNPNNLNVITNQPPNTNNSINPINNNNNNNNQNKPSSNTNNPNKNRSHSISGPKDINEIINNNEKQSNTNVSSNNMSTPQGPQKKIRNIYQYTHVGFDGEQDKANNQDIAFVEKKFAGNPSYYYMSVCDGHGVEGHNVSGYIKKILPADMSRNLNGKNLLTNDLLQKRKIHDIICKTFIQANEKLVNNENINSLFSGSTCVSLIYTPTRLICPNIGDSRAVLGRFNKENNTWVAHNLSRDHKPTEKDESERIIKCNGRIQPFIDEDTGQFIGPQRIWLKEDDVPGLAMTRSFGDRVAASVGVMSEPEILEYDFQEDDKFFIIASDGVWEFIDSPECVNFIKDYYLKNDLENCCKDLYQESKKRWLKEEEVIDDITMILVFLD